MTRVILASASPRRRELLAALIDDFEVLPSDVPEVLTHDGREDAIRLAAAKANAVSAAVPDAVVIGSDTVVHDSTHVYGKPSDEAEATSMLCALRGRAHIVTTGIAVARAGRIEVAVSDATVELAPLSDEAIAGYVRSGRPMDKAGAYAIQDADVPTLASLDGCYCCVMGLPLWLLRQMLAEAGIDARSPAMTIPRCGSCPEAPARIAPA